MASKSENFMRVLLGERPEWTLLECPAQPKFDQNAYKFVTYLGALPPRSVLAGGSPDKIRQAGTEIVDLFCAEGCLILEPDQIVPLPEGNLSVYWEAAMEATSVINKN